MAVLMIAMIAYFPRGATRWMALNVAVFPRDRILYGLGHRLAASFGTQMEAPTTG
jgi:hypothetical protein